MRIKKTQFTNYRVMVGICGCITNVAPPKMSSNSPKFLRNENELTVQEADLELFIFISTENVITSSKLVRAEAKS